MRDFFDSTQFVLSSLFPPKLDSSDDWSLGVSKRNMTCFLLGLLLFSLSFRGGRQRILSTAKSSS